MEDWNAEWEDESELPKSRSQKKQEVRVLESLGIRLAGMGEDAWKAVPLSPELRRSFEDYTGIRSHGARKRQEKRIGALMRHEDPEHVEKISRFLEDGEAVQRRERSRIQYLESVRDRLAAGDEDLAHSFAERPELDRHHFLFLVDQATREKKEGSPRGARRALFRYLKEKMEGDAGD
ncbi:DUF615 domain-containing protein [Desulfobotulus sp. H1]|uniref:DUF615 domain-containing protein n=1 Tax=Desulfobotulus pelophilus TaxID=2823377 RepID=A0ABT3N6U8_9BACT|nr:ribosome biogenesis factor YjgA [Desulfobotulus pelophilus]MCW7753187.1 DUF615 domain-containing protein [Desulfobotulus pelophilus]